MSEEYNRPQRNYSSKEKKDLDFIYPYYSNANAKPKISAVLMAYILIFVFAALITWAYFAQIDELARGNGKVIPTDKVQTIQSLDGGIISEISVKEGDIIKKDQALMKIDTTRFQASLEENKQEYLALLAVKSRLEKEAVLNIYKNTPSLKFRKEVLKDSSRYDKNESILFVNRVKELKSTIRVLSTQKKQKQQELKEIRSTIDKLKKSLAFIEQQRSTLRRLVDKGIRSKYDLIEVEKEYSQTKGDLTTAELSISRSKLAITEVDNKISEQIDIFKSQAANELQKTNGLINKFEARLVGDQDKVEKTTIVSPVDGIIKQINYNTIGGVVQSGADLVEIVPSSDALVVEAKIDPKDIAFINPSQKAIIKITAYDFSIYGALDGQIVEISADTIVDKDSKDGKTYYRVLVKTDKNFLERNNRQYPIIPGMIATVDIVTGKKTILDFILKPILKVKQDSLHER